MTEPTQGSLHGADLALRIYVTVTQLSPSVGLLVMEQGLSLVLALAPGKLGLRLDCLGQLEYRDRRLLLEQLDIPCFAEACGRPAPF